MNEVLFLKPVFKEAVWGGNKLKTDFGYDIPNDHTGECWAVSSHQNGDCRIKNGRFKGEKLSWLWENHRELFGNEEGDVFPLLIKIIDAKEDLSIQVHPNDAYAKAKEKGSLGKTECWYILDCEPGSQIVVGHNANSKEELIRMIEEHRFMDLIKIRPIKKGDFFQILPGTVHAIKGGTVILETQQSSNITYRLYDYDRIYNGKRRKLHIEKSIDVITTPYVEEENHFQSMKTEEYEKKELVQCKYYTVAFIHIYGRQSFYQNQRYEIVSVISGLGKIDGQVIRKGDHFILPYEYGEYIMEGEMELIISHT